MRIWIVVAAVVLGLFWYQQATYQRELIRQQERFQGAYKALQDELTRTRGNVLAAAKNASESRTELSRALQTEEEWSNAEVPAAIADAVRSRL